MVSAVGISTIDHLMKLEKFNDETREGTYFYKNYSIEGGGMAATALCAASKLGSQTRLFSRIGSDLNGKYILDGLRAFKVDTSGVKVIEETHSFTSFVFIEETSGNRQFWCERRHKVFEKKIDIDIQLLKGTKVLLVDGFWMEAAQQAVTWAVENNIPVVADFNAQYNGLDKLLPYIDYLIVPEMFAIKATGATEIPEALRSLRKMIKGIPVVTQGGKGGFYFDKNEIRRYPVFSIDCIDSTGAGDAFHGAFCHFLANGFPFDACLMYASAVGALNCREIGGRKGLPDIKELEGFVNK